jgi:PKD repeat protein
VGHSVHHNRLLRGLLLCMLALILAAGAATSGASHGWPSAAAWQQPSASITPTRDEINLNGVWDFTPLDGRVNPGVRATIRVPDAWDALPGFHDATRARYEKTVYIPSTWSGRAVFLEIYEANWHVDLVVNGAPFPRASEGIGIPTNIDITSAVRFGQDNTLSITVTQAGLAYLRTRPAGTFRWEQNLGLTGDVYLRAYPRLRVADTFVKTSVRTQQIAVAYEIRNDLGGARSITIEPRVTELDGTLVRTLPAQAISAGPGATTAAVQQSWTNPRLWSPVDPHLYTLETTIREGGGVVDVQRVRFGFREVWTSGADILLNGAPIVLFTDSNDLFQHAFLNYYYELWYDEATTRATVAKLKQSRNAIRVHQAPAVRPHVLDVFDEEGVLVIAESAMYAGSYTRSNDSLAGPSQSPLGPAGRAEAVEALSDYIDNAVAWIPKWIRRERNHPSIVIWSAENEMGPGWLTLDENQLRRLGDQVRAHDSTRPVIFEGDHTCCGSDFNSLHYNQHGPGNDWPTDNDVYTYAQNWWTPSKPNSQNEYAFTGWHGNGIFAATSGSSYTNLTSMQGSRLRGGLLTRGYRYQGWATLAPHTYIWQWADLYAPEDRIDDRFVERSFMPIAAFDVEYDRLGENPQPPVIPAGSTSFTRNIVIYNQETSGSDSVTLIVEARADGASTPFFTYNQSHSVPRGRKRDAPVTIQNLPSGSHWIQIELKVAKDGVERFAGETRDFHLDGTDAQPPAAPTGLRAELSGGALGVLDRRMVYLSWDMPNPRGDIAGWVIYRGASPNPTTIDDEVRLWGEREKFDFHNEYFDVVPAAGTYTYRIAARDLKGNLSGYSNQVTVVVTDSESVLRDPGFEMESRLYKNASNAYYAERTWGERWTLPAIVGGSQVAPHSGRFAGLINGDGAHAQNAFVDKFTFLQRAPRVSKAYHIGAYFKIEKVWRGLDDPDYWIRPGLRLAVVGGDGSGYFYNDFQAAFVDIPTLKAWAGDGRWHYVYFTMTSPPADSDSRFEVVARDGEGDTDPREVLMDAYVDDVVLAPLNKIPPVALTSASVVSVTAGQPVQFDAASSFAFNTSGAALPPNTGLTYAWDFGNGQTASTANPQATYPTPGEYVARVKVTDGKGLPATAQVFVTVNPPIDRKTASPIAARATQMITFTITLAGTGRPTSVIDALPPELTYLSAETTCPIGTLAHSSGVVTYSGTPPAGPACAIDIVTRVDTDQPAGVTNIASIDNGVAPVHNVSATVILNGFQTYLPLIRKGF